ncbi:MAG: YdeI/OmpD-associated family protein [Gudongella sp.]|nr:YdeI/OmpD-associated family protein [Gudongella sp.]
MTISFKSKLSKVKTRQIITIPSNLSDQLPSRGMVMVQGTINDVTFKAPLEPDGKGSHWLEISHSLSEKLGVSVNDTLSLNIEPIDKWIEPNISEDIMDAIIKADVLEQWNSTTTKARWDWIRWIRSTTNPETRKKRIDVACSKLLKGDKRPCCFDRSRCTITDVSRSGVLLD